VKESTLRDLGSRDAEFMGIVSSVNDMLLDVACVSKDEYTVIPIQGSGTYGVESVMCTAVHRRNGVLILNNGAYGQRMVDICRRHHIPYFVHEVSDNSTYNFASVEKMLNNEAALVSHIACVHSETTSGILNDLQSIGEQRSMVNPISSMQCHPLVLSH
jgi:2-aminoethylphosphonate-pyruvate transaminase